MIELPRACFVADRIAAAADFFSFGTNDLTQTALGFSRDDAERGFLSPLRGAQDPRPQPVRDHRQARRGLARAAGGLGGPRGQARAQARHLRRARRRSGLDRLLPHGRAGLRELLAVPRADRPGGCRTGRLPGRVPRAGMRRITISMAVLAFAVLVPPSALSHVERSSYWPDPAADTGVKPAAGGKVPKARSLSSALRKKPPRRHARGLPPRLAAARIPLDPPRPPERLPPPAQRAAAQALAQAGQAAAHAQPGLQAPLQVRQRPDAPCSARATTTASWSCRRATRRTSRARKPTNDPKCERARGARGQGRGRRELPLPGQLPERPEPDLRRQGRGSHRSRRRTRRTRTGTASPTRGRACAATCRSRARASRPRDVLIDAGRDPRRR